jgi:hypothetical protein
VPTLQLVRASGERAEGRDRVDQIRILAGCAIEVLAGQFQP